ncbi:papain-like cysteine protease family protein [Spongiactinospora rosea]|nr:papain-like cysteine protease family protein [Spongiactinospora rosea]
MRIKPQGEGARAARLTRGVVSGLAAVAVGVAVATVAPGAAWAGDLNIQQEKQQQNQWCWAASGLTIAKFLGKGNIDQNGFCNISRGRPQTGRCPNQAGYLQWVQRGFQALGLSPGVVGSPLAYASLKSQIDARKPVQTGIYWTAGGGHSQVIYGYDDASQSVSYGDPWPSSPTYSEMSYSQYRSNRQFRWAEALSQIGGVR